MLMVGSDSDKARSMFAFAMLSLAINYWVSHQQTSPAEPFIYFLNYKPLRHRYFIDAPALLAEKLLTKYVKHIPVNSASEIKGIIEETGSPYPYPFLDRDALGSGRVMSICAALYGICVLTSAFVITVARLIFI